MRIAFRLLVPAMLLLSCACSADRDLDGEHVWKEQTDTIEQAEEVEQMLQDATQQRDTELENQGG
jgi:hypothetical protein